MSVKYDVAADAYGSRIVLLLSREALSRGFPTFAESADWRHSRRDSSRKPHRRSEINEDQRDRTDDALDPESNYERGKRTHLPRFASASRLRLPLGGEKRAKNLVKESSIQLLGNLQIDSNGRDS